MDTDRFDVIVRALATAGSRRQVLTRLAGGAGGGILALLGLSPATAQDDDDNDNERDKDDGAEDDGVTIGAEAQCRKAGETCGGDQLCCEGLPCETGKDGVDRCGGEAACEGDCPTEEVKVARIRAYRIETDCAYDDANDRTTCNCAARGEANAPRVRRVTLPQADICAEVVAGEFEVVDNSVNTTMDGTGGQAIAEASGGQVVVQGGDQVNVDASGGQANANAAGGSGNVAIAGGGRGVRYASPRERDTLSLTFAGKVTTSGTATYWCETDNGPVPAVGPALVRDQEEIPADAGVLIVRAMSCDVDKPTDGFNWYGQCQRPAAKTRFRLKQLQGTQEVEKQNAETDDEGRRNFRGLAPGTYRLAPEGKGWCHAECDSADDKGDVLIEAGKRTSLWVFNCAKVK